MKFLSPQSSFEFPDQPLTMFYSKVHPPSQERLKREEIRFRDEHQGGRFLEAPFVPRHSIKSQSTVDTRDRGCGAKEFVGTRRSVSCPDLDEPIFSRKVFVGGLPTDVPREHVERIFGDFGNVMVDWPREAIHPKEDKRNARCHLNGYVFLVYDSEKSVQKLVSKCVADEGQFYLPISSPTVWNKYAQVRPWILSNINFCPFPNDMIDPTRTVFVGGVPRPTTARELALLLESRFGPVIYAGVDIDPELRYPKGAARVTFVNNVSYLNAIKGRFVKIPHIETNKREVEIKPYVMDDQKCDQCQGYRCDGKAAPYFCGNISCLQYYCRLCWEFYHFGPHSHRSRANHRPLVRQGDQTKELSELPRLDSDSSLTIHHLESPFRNLFSDIYL